MVTEKIIDLRKSKEEKREEVSRVEPVQRSAVTVSAKGDPGSKNQDKGITWQAFEFEQRAKDPDAWVRMTLLISVPLALVFLLLKNVLGAVVVLLSAVAFLLSAFKKPRELLYRVDEEGVVAGERRFAYDTLRSFWIFPETQGKMLSLKRPGMLSQHVVIPLGDIERDALRAYLLEHLTEEEEQPSVFDMWLNRIGY